MSFCRSERLNHFNNNAARETIDLRGAVGRERRPSKALLQALRWAQTAAASIRQRIGSSENRQSFGVLSFLTKRQSKISGNTAKSS